MCDQIFASALNNQRFAEKQLNYNRDLYNKERARKKTFAEKEEKMQVKISRSARTGWE